MKMVVFGLTVPSSWGNGHATLWRGLMPARWRRSGHRVVFFERDVPYYAAHRDLRELPGGELVLYETGTRCGARPGASWRMRTWRWSPPIARDGVAATALIVRRRRVRSPCSTISTRPVTLSPARAPASA